MGLSRFLVGRRAPVSLGLVALALAGCNWSTFADDAKKAPVRSIGAPSNFKAQDFGRSLLPLSNPQGKAAAFLATSINDPTIAVITVDVSGSVSSAGVPGAALNETESSVISSMAEDTGTSPLKVILGSPKVHNQGYGRVYSYLLSPTLEGNVTTLSVSTLRGDDTGLGRGLAVGRLGGSDAKSDYVVASDNSVVVLVDGIAATPPPAAGSVCDQTFDVEGLDARYRLRRPLLTARLWVDPAGAAQQQIVSASPHQGVSPGTVSFYSVVTTTDPVTGVATTAAPVCITSASAPKPEMRPRFGASLATGDFNGDGMTDLLVGAPAQNAYVYFGPFPTGALPTPVVIAAPDGLDFGFAVAALNVDGEAGDEALVSDPAATVGGVAEAGQVTAFKWNAATQTMAAVRTYHDHNPEAHASFGSTVSSLQFCTTNPSPEAGVICAAGDTSHILLVGASNEMFLYYREGANIPVRADGVADVRAP